MDKICRLKIMPDPVISSCELSDIEYFGPEHLPYGILAIIMVIVFSLLPTLLLALYP